MKAFEFTATAINGAGCKTNYVECIPWDNLDNMAANGVTFRVNGKKISKSKLVELYHGKRTADVIGKPAMEAADDMTPDVNKPAEGLAGKMIQASVNADMTGVQLPEGCPYTLDQVRGTITKFGKEVRCTDTNEVFMNQSVAAKYFGIDPAQVSDSIKTGRKRSGHTFEKVVW
ncbi:hypothetical protein [uncultured Duncaniella sp.]|uniref:hypothetical protein n=1 Tax=uncultured Duncaniella sp. TaxID=2768039 RepID=UPI002610B97F|nr:hypothetical protein [uncultured Duncaniella sp.]